MVMAAAISAATWSSSNFFPGSIPSVILRRASLRFALASIYLTSDHMPNAHAL
jgi:hypothetical protein